MLVCATIFLRPSTVRDRSSGFFWSTSTHQDTRTHPSSAGTAMFLLPPSSHYRRHCTSLSFFLLLFLSPLPPSSPFIFFLSPPPLPSLYFTIMCTASFSFYLPLTSVCSPSFPHLLTFPSPPLPLPTFYSSFLRSVLASEEFIRFTSAELLIWAVGVNTEEGVRVSYVLRENTYPFLALIVLKQSRMVVCERVEGGVMGVGELVTQLTRAIRDNEGELIVERNER